VTQVEETPNLENEHDEDGSHAEIENMSERQLQAEIRAMEAKLAENKDPDSTLTGVSEKRIDKAETKVADKVEQVIKEQNTALHPALMAI